MQQTTFEVALAFILSILCWIALVGGFFFTGKRSKRAAIFWEKMMQQWRAALYIAGIYLVASLVGMGIDWGRIGGMLLYTSAVFCQALVGLALARSIVGYEPLRITRAIRERKHLWQEGLWLVGVVALLIVVSPIASIIGHIIGQSMAHEVMPKNSGSNALPTSIWQLFFTLLSGAGIAEETVYRLVALSLVWRLTQRTWMAVLLSALLFGAYHLTPLDSLYLTFWQYPVTQFVSSAAMGIVLGIVYVKRGYEAAVIGHTLGDWVPILIFMR